MAEYAASEIRWIRIILQATALTNIAYAVLILFFQPTMYSMLDLESNYNGYLLQSMGIMSLAMGIGYFIASFNVSRYWPIVLMGLVVKILMPINVYAAYLSGEIALSSFKLASSYHIIWIIPFVAILYRVYVQNFLEDKEFIEFASEDRADALEIYTTNYGRTIKEVSFEQPVLLVFLRHFGCTFCRESLRYFSENLEKFDAMGTKIVLVHMVNELEAQEILSRDYGLENIEHVSDEETLLYKSFNLQRGTFNQLFGLKVWIRGFYAGLVNGNGIDSGPGNIYQMPGLFLIHEGEVMKEYTYESSADVPPYLELAKLQEEYEAKI